jgi:uncharacterized membrane protein YoaK (UPF0700 family)
MMSAVLSATPAATTAITSAYNSPLLGDPSEAAPSLRKECKMKLNLPIILSLNGGYVDTAGFLALQGLFTAHVTGNFVTLGAAIANGSSGIVAKLLALPVFCLAIILLRWVTLILTAKPQISLLYLLVAKFLFLSAGAFTATQLAPFSDPDGMPLILTGMLLVIAMAIQNAAHRIYLASAPPSTLMTGTTTQIMIDIVDVLSLDSSEARQTALARLGRFVPAVIAFAIGCGAAAFFYITFQMWCFLLPPFAALLGIAAHAANKEFA